MSIRSLEHRYSEARARFERQMLAGVAETGVDPECEATAVGEMFGIAWKHRSASEYSDVAQHLLSRYVPEVAYAVAVQINEQFERRVGYPPIGQIIVALERCGGAHAAHVIACSLRNFPRVETARLAFGVIKSDAMRSLLQANLAAEDPDLAEYICAGQAAMVVSGTPLAQPDPSRQGERRSGHYPLSDGIGRMPRRLTMAERRADRLFLHLQAASHLVLLFFLVLGAVLKGWPGAAVGLVSGFCVRVWMRRSMGLRGSNVNEGFFIRMRERANGSRRGLLEMLLERVRRRPFNRAQCLAIVQAWEETRRRLATATSAEEKRALIGEFDTRLKQISYGPDGKSVMPQTRRRRLRRH